LGPSKPQKHMIWCTYIGKTFCQVWTDHKLVNTTQKLQIISVDPWVRVTSSNTEYRILDGRYEIPVFKNVEVIHGK
jgi:hypothetical protein